MANNLANWGEDATMDWLMGGTTPTRPTSRNVKLHISNPGEDGLDGAASNSTRKAATFGASSGGTSSNSADINWTNVPTTEQYQYISIWDDLTAGHCLWHGPLTSPVSVTAGDDFTIATGDLSLTIS